MLDKLLFRSAAALAAMMLLIGMAGAVDIETVPVGNLGNDPDTRYYRSYGAVDYAYNIGKYEVTAGEYRDFLNAVATTSDPYGLYELSMDYDANPSYRACNIKRSEDGGVYSYSVAADWENRPVNYVSWYAAAMFCNWLTSGNIHQGAYDTSPAAGWGDSDASAYTGVTPHDSAAMDALAGTYGRVWVIPTEDEWYKAAYHMNDGDTNNYYDYPTSSNSAPGYVGNDGELSGTGTAFIDGVADPGNYATYDGDGGTDGIGPDYYRTVVGEWENSASPYGTFDQGGNLLEWSQSPYAYDGMFRGLRGGSFFGNPNNLRPGTGAGYLPAFRYRDAGFRVASIPEPGSITLLVCGLLGGLMWWRRRR